MRLNQGRLSPVPYRKGSELREFEILRANRAAANMWARAESVNDLLRLFGGAEVVFSPKSSFNVRYLAPNHGNMFTTVGSQNRPLVSVLVTAYNCAQFVRPSLESLLAQSYSNLQILIANDSSSDDTWSELCSMAMVDSRLHVFDLPENIGTYGAKSLLLKFAIGDYTVCHDIDDLADPKFIERSLSELVSNPRRVAVMSSWFRLDNELRIFPGAVRRFWPIVSLNFSSLMLRTNHLRALGGWDVPRVAADSELVERIKSVYGKRSIGCIDAVLTIGSMRSDSLMNHSHFGAVQAKTFRKRVAYRESFIRWHDDCKRRGVHPVMPSPLSAIRPYAVPSRFRVSHQAIARCYEAMLADSPIKPVIRDRPSSCRVCRS
jgi:glycosyltransferase involved in cell wall biosynthesis